MKRIIPLSLEDSCNSSVCRESKFRAQWAVSSGRFDALMNLTPDSTYGELKEAQRKYVHDSISFEDWCDKNNVTI